MDISLDIGFFSSSISYNTENVYGSFWIQVDPDENLDSSTHAHSGMLTNLSEPNFPMCKWQQSPYLEGLVKSS